MCKHSHSYKHLNLYMGNKYLTGVITEGCIDCSYVFGMGFYVFFFLKCDGSDEVQLFNRRHCKQSLYSLNWSAERAADLQQMDKIFISGFRVHAVQCVTSMHFQSCDVWPTVGDGLNRVRVRNLFFFFCSLHQSGGKVIVL